MLALCLLLTAAPQLPAIHAGAPDGSPSHTAAPDGVATGSASNTAQNSAAKTSTKPTSPPPDSNASTTSALAIPAAKDDRVRTYLASTAAGVLGATAVAALLSAALAVTAGTTGGVSILYRPLTFASGVFTPFNVPGGRDTVPIPWAFTTVELSFIMLGLAVMSTLPVWGLFSAALLVMALVTVYPDTRTNGMVRFLLRSAALHSLAAALLSVTGAPLLAIPALFSILLIVVPTTSGNLPAGAGRLTGFWGPPLLVAALSMLAAAAVLCGVAVDLTAVSRTKGT